MECVVTRITQIYIANQTPDDFLFVLLLEFEAYSLHVQLIRPHKMAILAMMTLQCMHPCMPLSVQPPIEEVCLQPFLCDVVYFVVFQICLYPRRTTEIILYVR